MSAEDLATNAFLQAEELCIAWLAMTFRKPFRWTEDRREHLTSGANCREHFYSVTAYADTQGKLLGVDAEITVDAGAYSVWPFTACLEGTMAAGHFPGPYAFAGYRSKSRSVATNKPAILPYRGVARTGICFAMELTIDAVARAVGREPWEVRRENLVSDDAMPYVNPTGKVYDSGDYRRSLDIAVREIDLPAVRAKQAAMADTDHLIGVGFANYIEMTAHGTKLFAGRGTALCSWCGAGNIALYARWGPRNTRRRAIPTDKAWRPRWRRSPMRCLASISARSPSSTEIPN